MKIKKYYFLVLIFVLSALAAIKFVYADTTAILLPVSDGTDDSALWVNKSGTACSGVDCFTEVNESNGAVCSGSDGDGSYIAGSAAGANQTFDIDESSIPDGAIITQADVMVCHKKAAAGQSNIFRLRGCIDGACINAGSDIVAGANYNQTTQSFAGLNILKTPTTDLEIGAIITGVTNRTIRISQISVVFTYTFSPPPPPAECSDGLDNDSDGAVDFPADFSCSLADDDDETNPQAQCQDVIDNDADGKIDYPDDPGCTDSQDNDETDIIPPPPDDEPPDEGGGGGGGGPGVAPARVIFAGRTYPGGAIEVLRKSPLDEIYLNIPIETLEIKEDGAFRVSYVSLISGEYLFALRAKDKEGRKSGILSFSQDLLFKDQLVVEDIIFPPTLEIKQPDISRGQTVEIFGSAPSRFKVEIFLGDQRVGEAESDDDGLWSYLLNAGELSPSRIYYLKTRSVNPAGKLSNFSPSLPIRLAEFNRRAVDFNQDEKVNIADWSIFLFRWGSDDINLKNSIDLDGNGRVDIADFSIFLKTVE